MRIDAIEHALLDVVGVDVQANVVHIFVCEGGAPVQAPSGDGFGLRGPIGRHGLQGPVDEPDFDEEIEDVFASVARQGHVVVVQELVEPGVS